MKNKVYEMRRKNRWHWRELPVQIFVNSDAMFTPNPFVELTKKQIDVLREKAK